MSDLKVGGVKHFYDKIGVAIVELTSTLAVGDKIKITRGGETVLEQVVDSIQVEHQKITSAKKGDIVGIKVEGSIKDGAEVYKIN